MLKKQGKKQLLLKRKNQKKWLLEATIMIIIQMKINNK